MERSDVRSLYRLAGFLVFAYSLPFVVGLWAGTVHADTAWLANLVTVVLGGLMQGGIYAMFAVGLTLIFGVMRIINAAHGEMVMMGAYLTWMAFFYLGIDPLLALVLTLPLAFLFGMVVQKTLLDSTVGQPELTALLITFGLGLVMVYTAELIFTTDFRTIPYAPGTVQLTANIAIGQNRMISFAMAVVITTAVYLFLKFSRLGKAVRATALNTEVAMVCGIDVKRIYLVTTGLAAALAAAGGALVSIQFGFNPETGVLYTLQAFAIIVLGGRGHYVGALIGGLMLGVLENLVSLMVPNGTAMVELAAYGLMIFVLLIRPGGLMGVKEG
ncbi:MAG TPA: branched-chain amino acid ABC transporter permease [Candidatus Acidoferrum sp.]|jgi:branched-chain amino acid transport system permease protein|nr:branched-chain amino acid ABC transporter permease [Candidatus Acidoferrum sp.]